MLVFFWDGLFSGAKMLVSGSVFTYMIPIVYESFQMGLGGSKGCHPKIQENTVYPGFVCFCLADFLRILQWDDNHHE